MSVAAKAWFGDWLFGKARYAEAEPLLTTGKLNGRKP